VIGRASRSLRQARLLQTKDRREQGGRRGEDLAHRRLPGKGFAIAARNFRLPSGDPEADLIAWDGETLVLVEGKSCESADWSLPDRAIRPEKPNPKVRVACAYSSKTDTPRDRILLRSSSRALRTDPGALERFPGVRIPRPRYSVF